MRYHQFKRFMWFPLLRRFLWSWSAFKFAWRNCRDDIHWSHGCGVWMQNVMPFRVGTFGFIGGKGGPPTALPNGLEPFELKKRCIGPAGEVRFFDVVPDGYTLYDYERPTQYDPNG